ncbi:DUF4184 family protein [Kitasatospora sp. NPDC008115]|uniref:DUF4184 family protein n=1 Tax=Kitasatospora sp. NPDC008115 TaxID=3364022 RepID=UPI0036EF7A32
MPMPFTLSHPAAVLPLLRRPFSRTALVAGTVAPDLPYFVLTTGLPVSAQSWYEPFVNATTSHSTSGVPTVALPYALALWALFRAGRRPLAALLSLSAPAAPSGRWVRRGGWVVLSALIGAATHVVWDAFTHMEGLARGRVLQHASTVLGLALLAVYLWRRRAGLRLGRSRALPAIALCTAAAAAAHAWRRLAGPEASIVGLPLPTVIEGVLSDAAKGAGAGLLAALVLYVTAWWIHHAVGRTAAATPPTRSGTRR